MTPADTLAAALLEVTDRPLLAVWVAGSHAHGLADPLSDVDLRAVAAPSADDILMGEARWTRSAAGADVTVMTPLSFHDAMAKGSHTQLEALTLPDDCLISDAGGLLAAFRPLAGELTTRATVDSALGNARSNLHLLARRGDWDERRIRKTQAETLRLLAAAGIVSAGGRTRVPWPCRLDPDDLEALMQVRREGMDPAELERQLPVVAEYAAAHRPPNLSKRTRARARDSALRIQRTVLDGSARTVTAGEAGTLLAEWERRL